MEGEVRGGCCGSGPVSSLNIPSCLVVRGGLLYELLKDALSSAAHETQQLLQAGTEHHKEHQRMEQEKTNNRDINVANFIGKLFIFLLCEVGRRKINTFRPIDLVCFVVLNND